MVTTFLREKKKTKIRVLFTFYRFCRTEKNFNFIFNGAVWSGPYAKIPRSVIPFYESVITTETHMMCSSIDKYLLSTYCTEARRSHRLDHRRGIKISESGR